MLRFIKENVRFLFSIVLRVFSAVLVPKQARGVFDAQQRANLVACVDHDSLCGM